jgi:hypothetical protein
MLVVGLNNPSNDQDPIVLLATTDGIDYEPVINNVEVFSQATVTAGTLFEGRIVMVGHSRPSGETELAYQWVWTP